MGKNKISIGRGTLEAPLPAVMVSCARAGERPNIITIEWTGIVCSEPPMCYISVRPERYSHDIIENSGEFVINLVSRDMARAMDLCGVVSGRDHDKFVENGLTPEASQKVGCPGIAESPVSIECRVTEKMNVGSHDMFIAEIINVTIDPDLLDASGRARFDKADLIACVHGGYYGLDTDEIGRFGYSVMKPKTEKRKEKEKKAARRNVFRAKKK